LPGIKRLHEISVQDHRLRYLSLAAQHGSMRAAADLLGIAPSSISRQIGQLERDLKIDLVEKGSHRIRLTEAGQLLIDFHETRAAEHRALLERLSELRNTSTDTVRIASGEGLLTPAMMASLAGVARQHPRAAFDVTIAPSTEVQRLVLVGAADIGIVFETPDDVRLRIRTSISQPIQLILRPDAPLAGKALLSLAEVAQERLLMPGAAHRLSEIVHSVLRDHSLVAGTVVVANALGPIIDGVRAGLGVALMPAILADREIEEGSLVARPIACADFQTTRLHIVSRIGRPLSPSALSLISSLASNLNGMAPA
jgi:DNA-binding transcriptional LysR family regulator